MYKPIKGYDFMSPPQEVKVEKLTPKMLEPFDLAKWEKGRFGIRINGQLLCYHRTYMDQSRIIPTLCRFTKANALELVDFLKRLNYPFPHPVYKFTYDGFGGQVNKNVIMPYTARFKKWSGDPGVALMICSDGTKRWIPSFALKFLLALPNDFTRLEKPEKVTLIGQPSNSD